MLPIFPQKGSPEYIANVYKTALDSVLVINTPKEDDVPQEQYLDKINRNVRHLEIILQKSFWSSEDLKPLEDAVAAGKSILAE